MKMRAKVLESRKVEIEALLKKSGLKGFLNFIQSRLFLGGDLGWRKYVDCQGMC